MRCGLRIAADAIADLRKLDPWLQEASLDGLERPVERASALHIDRFGETASDFERCHYRLRHTIFLRLTETIPDIS